MNHLRPMPDSFAADAALSLPTLKVRYHASEVVILRWRRELGLRVRPGRKPGPQEQRRGGNFAGPNLCYNKAECEICLTCPLPDCTGDCKRIREAMA